MVKKFSSKNTTDKVFLLSIQEAEKYFDSDESRMCKGPEYCCAQRELHEKDRCYWWLRSPGRSSNSAAYIDADGVVCDNGMSVVLNDYAVRPAMRIKIES